MTSMSRTERADLCDTALEVGEDQPTLSGEWTVKDLLAHLALRESSPEMIGSLVPALSKLTDRGMRRLTGQDFTVLVDRVRNGPPKYSPFAIPAVGRLANTVELFVHHEDIRRAQPDWTPRELSSANQDVLWKTIQMLGKMMVRGIGVGVVLERSDTGQRAVLKRKDSSVTVQGTPSELSLFLFGRSPQVRVQLVGSDADVATLESADLGI